MVFKQNISRYKQKLLILLSALFIALLFQPKQIAYASSVDWDALVSAIVNSTHSNNVAGTTTIQNGVSIERTGYLVYMVNKETGAPTSDAKAFYAGSNWISGSQWIVKSRHGGLSASTFSGNAEWGKPWIPPASKGDSLTSLEPNIKEWFRINGSDFVNQEFPSNHSNFVADTEVLVLETILNCQFSTGSGNSNQSPGEAADKDIESLGGSDDYLLATNIDYLGFSDLAMEYFDILYSGIPGAADDAASFMQNIRSILKQYLVAYYQENGTGDSQSRTYHGSPVIGTVPNLLAYDQWNTTVFDSYLNNAAPNAEKIVYSEAGFTAYPGSGKMTDADVQNYGVAMMIIHCKDPAQTTCDEPQAGTPHDPPKESEGKVTIVKSYRDKINNVYTHKATTHRSNLGTQILIENEKEYQVVEWVTSSTTNTGVKGYVWSPPVAGVSQRGTTPTSVTLSPTEKCLYVLLEKVEEEPEEEKPYNYKLTQSMITRRVWFSNPDDRLTNMTGEKIIENYGFIWSSPAHNICNGHTYYGDCAGNHHASCDDVGCTVGCPDSCAKTHHEPDCLPGCMTQHEHEKCPGGHTQSCMERGASTNDECSDNQITVKCGEANETDWNWLDNSLHLSIDNVKQNDFQRILATKKGWNAEVVKDDIIKHFYNNGQVTRTQFAKEYYPGPNYPSKGDDNWDYVCILMRGADKLTVAEWVNAGQGNPGATAANADLKDVSSEGFAVANQDSGTRKKLDYYEIFSTEFNIEKNEGDIYTQSEAKKEAKDDDGWSTVERPGASNPCKITKEAKLENPLSINDITVKIEVYSGAAEKGVNDTSCNGAEMIQLPSMVPGYNTSSGRMVPSGDIISFRPYILMRYDTVPEERLPAFVLSEYQRQMTPNDYAEITWDKKSSDNLSLVSAQWSTHADAIKDIRNIDSSLTSADNVLPGGATLSLNIEKNNRQKVIASTYQCIVEGHGKDQIDKAGGSYGNLTRDNAVSAHNAYVATITAALESTNVKQYVEKNPNKSDALGGTEVYPGANISSLGNTSDGKASTEAKYYFRDEGDGAAAGQGDFDVKNNGTDTTTYTFYTCVDGHIHVSVDNTTPSTPAGACGGSDESGSPIAQAINARTYVVDKLKAAVEEDSGADGEAINRSEWYNEAFDGVTVIVQRTELEVGYNDPPERSSVLDPKLTPKQKSQKTLFSNYFLSQFKTKDYSQYYGSGKQLVMGEFKNVYVKMKDLDSFFYSRRFWIPNVTTQDLH